MRRLDDDHDDVAFDGEVVHRPLILKDHNMLSDHQPGHRVSSDSTVRDARIAARDARESWIRDLTTGWKRASGFRDAGPEPDLGTPPEPLRRHLHTEPDDDAQARRDRAYQEYVRSLDFRTRGRSDPTRAANEIEREGERVRGGR
jgi:hypothetical protein